MNRPSRWGIVIVTLASSAVCAEDAPTSSPSPVFVITGVSLTRPNLSSFTTQVRDSLAQQLGATLVGTGSEKNELAISGDFGLGWHFNRYAAAELAIGGSNSVATTQTGRIRDATGEWGFEARSRTSGFIVHLTLVGTLPLSDRFEVFGRLGATRAQSEAVSSLSCVADCALVQQHDGYPTYSDDDGHVVQGRPDSPPAAYSRTATFRASRSIVPVLGAGLRWRSLRLEYRAFRMSTGQNEVGPDQKFFGQPRLQLAADHALFQSITFTYLWGAPDAEY